MVKINKFGAFIRERRLEKKLGLREFAKKINVSATYISRIESGACSSPSEKRIIEMAKVLGGDPDFYLAMGDKINPETHIAIVSSLGLWSHFIRNRPDLVIDFLDKAKKDFNKKII